MKFVSIAVILCGAVFFGAACASNPGLLKKKPSAQKTKTPPPPKPPSPTEKGSDTGQALGSWEFYEGQDPTPELKPFPEGYSSSEPEFEPPEAGAGEPAGGEGEYDEFGEEAGGYAESEGDGEGQGEGEGEAGEGEAGAGEPASPGGEPGAPGGPESGTMSESGTGGQPGQTPGGLPGSPEPGAGTPAGTGASTSAGSGSGTQSSRGGGSIGADDDIVARQLREAAEKETDPVVREKLWKEYNEYKKQQ